MARCILGLHLRQIPAQSLDRPHAEIAHHNRFRVLSKLGIGVDDQLLDETNRRIARRISREHAAEFILKNPKLILLCLDAQYRRLRRDKLTACYRKSQEFEHVRNVSSNAPLVYSGK